MGKLTLDFTEECKAVAQQLEDQASLCEGRNGKTLFVGDFIVQIRGKSVSVCAMEDTPCYQETTLSGSFNLADLRRDLALRSARRLVPVLQRDLIDAARSKIAEIPGATLEIRV